MYACIFNSRNPLLYSSGNQIECVINLVTFKDVISAISKIIMEEIQLIFKGKALIG